MSVRTEWFSAEWSTLTVAPAGEEIGEDTVNEGNVGLVLDGGECAVLEGTPEQIRNMLTDALRQLDSLTK